MTKLLKSKLAKCSNCGANMVFSPKHSGLYCENCESVEKIQTCEPPEKTNIDSVDKKDASYKEWIANNKIFKCSNCGASVVSNNLEVSQVCPYCSSSLMCDEESLPGIRPDAIIPFKFDKKEASEKFAVGVKKKLFIPNAFKKALPESNIKGLYIPTFDYDAQTSSVYRGSLIHTESIVVNGRTETIHSIEHISGHVDCSHKNISVEACSKISQNEFDFVKPYNYSELVKFDDRFLRGYFVEVYDNSIENTHSIARDIMDNDIKKNILKKYTYSEVKSLDVNTKYYDEKVGYYLLPSYKFHYNYKGKNYETLMNGQTGKVGGGVPRSKLKIGIFVSIIILIIALIFVLGYFI